MNRSHQETHQSDSFAGIYLQMGGHPRFWGWGTPPFRVGSRPEKAEVPTGGEGRIRFVCNHKFVGLLVR